MRSPSMRWLRITVIALLACVVIAGAWALVGPDGALRTRPVAVENAITSGTAAYPSLDFTPAVAVAETVSLPATRTLADFDAGRARDHAAAIAAMGVRREGGSRERRAASYIRAKLESWGYEVGTQRVPLPGSAVSINVVAVREGVSARRKVLGAHIDSKSPSPGANDNASGTGVVLELARVFSERRPAHTTVFAFFGAEEMWDSNPDHHHYGSRRYVRGLSSSERDEIVGMVSVDMVGRGTGFTSRTMGAGDPHGGPPDPLPGRPPGRLDDVCQRRGTVRVERSRALRAGRDPGHMDRMAARPVLPHLPRHRLPAAGAPSAHDRARAAGMGLAAGRGARSRGPVRSPLRSSRVPLPVRAR